jgi:hypothetical protein
MLLLPAVRRSGRDHIEAPETSGPVLEEKCRPDCCKRGFREPAATFFDTCFPPAAVLGDIARQTRKARIARSRRRGIDDCDRFGPSPGDPRPAGRRVTREGPANTAGGRDAAGTAVGRRIRTSASSPKHSSPTAVRRGECDRPRCMLSARCKTLTGAGGMRVLPGKREPREPPIRLPLVLTSRHLDSCRREVARRGETRKRRKARASGGGVVVPAESRTPSGVPAPAMGRVAGRSRRWM